VNVRPLSIALSTNQSLVPLFAPPEAVFAAAPVAR
jgi:hypothetical protein